MASRRCGLCHQVGHDRRSCSSVAEPNIYLYRVQTDVGCAPNISHNVLSLAICKPKIRLGAKVGDWIVGLRARSGEIARRGPHPEDSVLYVMRVTRKMSMAEYYTHCAATLPMKIPCEANEFMGDAMYTAEGEQLPGPHGPALAEHDLSGKYVLLAEGVENYWYCREGVRLPAALVEAWNVVSVGRGHHKKTFTEEMRSMFELWLCDW